MPSESEETLNLHRRLRTVYVYKSELQNWGSGVEGWKVGWGWGVSDVGPRDLCVFGVSPMQDHEIYGY